MVESQLPRLCRTLPTLSEEGQGWTVRLRCVQALHCHQAYRDLAVAAAKADKPGEDPTPSALLLLPLSALNLQIVSDLVLSAMEDAEGGSEVRS